MEIMDLTNREQYEYAVSRGYEPLIDIRFRMAIDLRIDIQRELFGLPEIGKKNIPRANQKFYYWVWEHKSHVCEELMVPLYDFSSKFISHILTRGGHPEMAHDPRNTNILSFAAHQKWEDPLRRRKMRIYPKNIRIMQVLKVDYLNAKNQSI